MPGLLTEVSARYEAAAHAQVEVHDLAWPTMRELVTVLSDLRRAAEAGVSRRLEELIDRAAQFHRLLTSTPLSPVAALPSTADLAEEFRAHRVSAIDSHLSSQLRRAAELIDAVGASSHPAAGCLEDVLSRYGRLRPEDPPAVYIAVRRADEVTLVRAWLRDVELDAEVKTFTELRYAPVRDAVVLLGPPAWYGVSAWCSLADAALVTGWLVTAPPARHVHIVTWPGHPRFDGDGSVLFPTTAAPAVTFSRRDGEAPAPEDHVAWLPPEPVAMTVRVDASWRHDSDPVDAVAVQLTRQQFVLFSDEEDTPKAHVVTWESAGVDITVAELSSLSVGQALLFRPHRSADEELYRRADERLVEKCGHDAPAKAAAVHAALKAAYEASPTSDEQLVDELTSKLNNRTYARHIVASLPRSDYIAPERAGAYDVLRVVLRMSPDASNTDYRMLAALRSARRRAGLDITRDLVGLLRQSDDWQGAVETEGHASITLGDGLGRLEMRVVTAVSDEAQPVGRNRLGKLMEAPLVGGTVVAMSEDDQ